MAGLVPAIHGYFSRQGVDARVKPEDDDFDEKQKGPSGALSYLMTDLATQWWSCTLFHTFFLVK